MGRDREKHGASEADAGWFRALLLAERLKSLRDAPKDSIPASYDQELALRREAHWRSQPAFSDDACFASRWAAAGIDLDELAYLLGESAEDIQRRQPFLPGWIRTILDAYRQEPAAAAPAIPGLDGNQRLEPAELLELVRPLMAAGFARMLAQAREIAAAHPRAPFEPARAGELLTGILAARLLSPLGRTAILELQIARVEGSLTGDTAEERFQCFVDRLRKPELALGILRQYPVLARYMVGIIERWLAASCDFLRHLCRDADAIRASFGSELGTLEEIEGGVGDPHRGGRTVLLLRFDSGLGLAYKPRSLAAEHGFQQVLGWANERGFEPPLRSVRVLDRGDHGWMELVAPSPCSSGEAVERFYQRQGGLLALLYVLGGTDIHFENVIAADEHPVVVDLETLFHPYGADLGTSTPGEAMGYVLYDTVLRVGLLPQRLWADQQSEGVDLSGLGAGAGQVLPKPVLQLQGRGTDRMHFALGSAPVPTARNQPTLAGEDISLRDRSGAVELGFRTMYRLLERHREELLGEQGLLRVFEGAEVRVVLRPTRSYVMLLIESLHPRVLGDGLHREQLLDALWGVVDSRPYMHGLVPHELQEVEQGDVPLFTTRTDSRDLFTGTGERLQDMLAAPALVETKRRIRRLGEDDLARQCRILRGALDTFTVDPAQAGWASYEPQETTPAADRDAILEAARAAGDYLAGQALRGRHDVHWLTAQPIGTSRWSQLPAGPDLYHGLPGMALFLGYLGAITRASRFTELARMACATWRFQMKQMPSALESVGAFGGWGGSIYALSHLGVLWDQPELLGEAEAIAQGLRDKIVEDTHYDVVGGAAGCLLGLLALQACKPSERTLEMAMLCGEHLLGHAMPMERGIGWQLALAGPHPLAGMSHGAAGICVALHRLARVTGVERFRDAAAQGLAYERSLFSPEVGNWRDLRHWSRPEEALDERFDEPPVSWCHGAPGIGLTRLELLRQDEDPERRRALREDLDAAIAKTLASGFGKSHCLCHGALGNLELLAMAARQLPDHGLQSRVDGLTAGALASIRRDGWLYGYPLGLECLGLMVGVAGIGHGLLRLAAPERVPSILLLEAPPGHGAGSGAASEHEGMGPL